MTLSQATAPKMPPSLAELPGDPLAWLLDGSEPAVRHRALRELLDLPPDDPAVVEARDEAMATGPISTILAAQDPAGWWVRPGSGYLPKYSSTVWSLMFLDQLGADPDHPRIQAACDYVLDHAQTSAGGFGILMRGEGTPPPSATLTCLTGNLLRALLGFGRLRDPRLAAAIDWQAAVITGEGDVHWYKSSHPGPGFQCAANEGQPCAWGATKALLGLVRIPEAERSSQVVNAIDAAVAFLLGTDPSRAGYPTPSYATGPSSSWFRLGFPSAYVTDVLQVLEACCEAGAAGDPRLAAAIDWLMAQQVEPGRWPNRYAYGGKMLVDIDVPNRPSRWVTLRACRVLKAVRDAADGRRAGGL